MNESGCELCGDQPVDGLELRSACHMTAPLTVSRIGNELVIRCYVPDCSREVARFTLAPTPETDLPDANPR